MRHILLSLTIIFVLQADKCGDASLQCTNCKVDAQKTRRLQTRPVVVGMRVMTADDAVAGVITPDDNGVHWIVYPDGTRKEAALHQLAVISDPPSATVAAAEPKLPKRPGVKQ